MNAVYTRQSLDVKDSLSIESQLDACLNENGSAEYQHYNDKGYSGKNTERPAFRQLMADVRKGTIERVIVYRLDRLSRSLLDFAEMIDVFKKKDVEFVSCREKFDTSTPIGNAMLSIIMVFAQLERETIQMRVKDNYATRMERGAYDGVAPYGFDKAIAKVGDKQVHTLDVNEVSDTVRSMFNEYAYTGDSLGAIAKKLNAEGIPSPGEAPWDGGKISRILSNPIYVRANADIYAYYNALGMTITNPIEDFLAVNGCITYGGWERSRRKFSQYDRLKLSIGLHPGLVDSDTFLRCQTKLKANRQICNAGKGKHSWLTGMVKCGYCGHSLKVMVDQKGRGIRRFVCSGNTNCGICSQFGSQRVDELEAGVEHELMQMVERRKYIEAKIEMERDTEESRIKIEQAKISEKLNRLVDALAEGEPSSASVVMKKIAELEEKKKLLEVELRSHRAKLPSQQELLQFRDTARLWPHMTIQQKREVAKLLIDKIEVKSDKMQIYWKYNFEL